MVDIEIIRNSGSELPQDFRANSSFGSKDQDGVAQMIQNFLEYRDRGYLNFTEENEITSALIKVASSFGGRHVWITQRPALEGADTMLTKNPTVDVGVVDSERVELGHQTTIVEADLLVNAIKQKGNPQSARVVKSVGSADLVIVEEVQQALEVDTEGKNLLDLFPIAVVIGTTSTDVSSEIGLIEEKFGPLINKPKIGNDTTIEGEEAAVIDISFPRRNDNIRNWPQRNGAVNAKATKESGNGVDAKKGSGKKDCVHHWIIGSPNGPQSPGECKHCHARKKFSTGFQWDGYGIGTYSNSSRDSLVQEIIGRTRDRSMNDEY